VRWPYGPLHARATRDERHCPARDLGNSRAPGHAITPSTTIITATPLPAPLGSKGEEPCYRFNVLQDQRDENVCSFYEVYGETCSRPQKANLDEEMGRRGWLLTGG